MSAPRCTCGHAAHSQDCDALGCLCMFYRPAVDPRDAEIATLRQRLAEAHERNASEVICRERLAEQVAALRLEVETLTAQHAAAWDRANATLRSMLLPCPKCGDGIREGTLAVDGPDGRPEHLACPKDLAAEVRAELVAERDEARTEAGALIRQRDAACQGIATLQAARRALASEFPPDEEGDPDVGSIHENIRKLKAATDEARTEVERLREGIERLIRFYGHRSENVIAPLVAERLRGLLRKGVDSGR